MDIMEFRENVIWFYDINDIKMNYNSSEFKKNPGKMAQSYVKK